MPDGGLQQVLGRDRMRGGLLGAVLGVLLLAGCTVVVTPPEPAQPQGSRPAPSRSAAPSVTPSPQPETRAQDETDAVNSVNGFWEQAFPEVTGRPYEPPAVAGGYRGTSGPSCGGEPSVPGNAFYCPAGDFLAWDEDLMEAGYEQIGDAWVYLIIAHEWGHAIQARLSRSQVSVAAELQADCLAGAALQGAADQGSLRIEPGDSEEIARTLVAVADDFPWTDVSSHGDAQQRTSAFAAGVDGGVGACT